MVQACGQFVARVTVNDQQTRGKLTQRRAIPTFEHTLIEQRHLKADAAFAAVQLGTSPEVTPVLPVREPVRQLIFVFTGVFKKAVLRAKNVNQQVMSGAGRSCCLEGPQPMWRRGAIPCGHHLNRVSDGVDADSFALRIGDSTEYETNRTISLRTIRIKSRPNVIR